MTNRRRRQFLRSGIAVTASVLSLRGRAQSERPAADVIDRQLPLDSVGIEHIGLVVGDVTASARFFAGVFNPHVYREMAPPLRYYVTLDPGYIAVGSREGVTESFIDHDCVLVDGYDRAAMAVRLEREGIPAGRFGVLRDPDGLGFQLLPVGGLAPTTEPAGRLVEGEALLRPRGLQRVRRVVHDLERSVRYYRQFFGPEERVDEQGAVWFAVAHTEFVLRQAAEGEDPAIESFTINVADSFDPARLRDAIVALGAEEVSIATGGDSRFRSPDGIVIELRPVDPARIWGR